MTKRNGNNGNGCHHFWLLDLSNQGTCKLCGETRDFRALQLKDKGWLRTFAPKGKKTSGVVRYIGLVGKSV